MEAAWTNEPTKAPFSRRVLNHGCMFVADNDIELTGAGSVLPRRAGALTIAQDIRPTIGTSPFGGPYADGLGAKRDPAGLGGAGYTGHAFRTWLLHRSPRSDGALRHHLGRLRKSPTASSAGGVNIKDMYKLTGKRIKATREIAGKDTAEVVMRPITRA